MAHKHAINKCRGVEGKWRVVCTCGCSGDTSSYMVITVVVVGLVVWAVVAMLVVVVVTTVVVQVYGSHL